MTNLQTHMHGLWLPLVTPFRDGRLDETSLRRLTRHYGAQAVDGFILGATSGEGMTPSSNASSPSSATRWRPAAARCRSASVSPARTPRG